MNNEFTIQDIENCLKRLDIAHRPYLIYCHPTDKEELLATISDSQMIEDIPWMEPGKLIAMDRVKLEKEYQKFFDSFVNYKEIGNE